MAKFQSTLMNILLLLTILCVVVSIGIYVAVKEGFGYSMGTMIQLQTSHVPGSVAEMEEEEAAYVRQVQHDLVDMTGSGL
jgi:hypothetical protein